MKSSVDAEVTLDGRRYGGVGFICKKIPGILYIPIVIDNDRICGMKIISSGKIILTIIGVYMQYYDGSSKIIKIYNETLQDIQCIIDTNDPIPIMIIGDMNATLPQSKTLGHQWYKRHPYNKQSLLLHDFLINNDLYCCNFDLKKK